MADEELLGFVKKLVELKSLLPSEEGVAPTPEEAIGVMNSMKSELEKLRTAKKDAEVTEKLLTDATELVKCKREEMLGKIQVMLNGSAGKENELQQKIADLEKESKERKAEELLVANARKIAPGENNENREFWKRQAIENYENTKKFLEKQPDILPATKPAPPDDTVVALTAEDKEVCKIIGTTEAEMIAFKKVEKEGS